MIYVVLLIGFLLRLINLNQSLWLDEAITALAVKNNSFVELITKFAPGDFHPPLYYLFLKLWTDYFGYAEIDLRLPSVIFGTIAIFVVYKLGNLLKGQKVGLIAALFLAVNPLAIYYSQEARMYSLAMLAVVGSVYFFFKKKLFLYVLTLAIALYSDYLPWLMLPVFIYWGYKEKRNVLWVFAPLIILIPAIPLLLNQLLSGLSAASSLPAWSKVLGSFEIKSLPLTFVKFIIGRISLDNKLIYAGVIIPIGAVYLWTLSKARETKLWQWLLVPLIVGTLISLRVPIFSYFRFLFVLPAFILLLAISSERNKWLMYFVFAVSLVSLAIFNINPTFQREDWRSALEYMQTGETSAAVMPSLAQAAPLQYYNDLFSPSYVRIVDRDGVIGYPRTVYLIRYVQEIFDPEDKARKEIEDQGFGKVEERSFNGVVVWKYMSQ